MSKFLPYEVRQTVVRNGQFSTCEIDEASTFQVAKQIAWRACNGNPTTHIHNVLTKEIWENRQGLWTSIGWDK